MADIEDVGELRENVSYAVGNPYSIFDYIPHTVFKDGSVKAGSMILSQDAIEQMWRTTHNWEPIAGWKETRTSAGIP
jgi:hypothetical protein